MLPDSALHQTLLVVYAVLWAAITPTFGRLRAFALNTLDRQAWRRFAIGVLICNLAPVALLAALVMGLPEVCGFWGIVAGGSLGITPAVFPRLLHAALASNEALPKSYTPPEAKQVLLRWDEQWATQACTATDWNAPIWSGRLRRLLASKTGAFRRNRLTAHLAVALTVGSTPLVTGLLIVTFVSPGY